MPFPNIFNNYELDLNGECAYSLPAVALTLGCENWHLLKGTVKALASDRKYSVRRTIAACLHELASILGPEVATNSLTPLFDDFFKDLDEVRIEVLKHLAEFLSLINPVKRSSYLPKLSEFLKVDRKWNWRFREELAKQLYLAVPLFRPNEVTKHISVIGQELLCDNVAAVRQSAIVLVRKKVCL